MKKPPPLLLTDDISLETGHERRSDAVKTCARKLARKLGTSIELVHVEDLLLYPVNVAQYKPLISRYFKEQKAKLANVASSLGVPTKAHFLSGEPTKKILALAARKNSYEMIVLGTHGRTGLSRLILGSVAEEVIRQARIPVLTVGPKAQESGSTFLEQPNLTILIPTSLTPNSVPAEDYGVALARRLGASVVFFHAMYEGLHPVLQTAFSVPTPPPQIQRFFEETKADSLKWLAKKAEQAKRKGVTATFALDSRTLDSSTAVVKESGRTKASLIVMGTHGRRLVSGAFFGRTVRDVILSSAVPVITVHSKKP